MQTGGPPDLQVLQAVPQLRFAAARRASAAPVGGPGAYTQAIGRRALCFFKTGIGIAWCGAAVADRTPGRRAQTWQDGRGRDVACVDSSDGWIL